MIEVLKYGGSTSLKFHFVSDCKIPGTFIGPPWLEGETRSRVPCPSPHWDNRWSPGMIRILTDCGAEVTVGVG